MNPGIRTGQTPPFYQLHPRAFEEMCRDLFQQEPNVSTCDIYGIPGQMQDGIDVKACRKNGDGIEVGQCKCYKVFPPAKIKDVSDEFFKYWESHWKHAKVRRFILFVACELNTRQQIKEVEKQQEKFAQYDITYEAWSAPVVSNKLRPHKGIVATYCDPPKYWVETICGETLSPHAAMPDLTPGYTTAVTNALVQTTINSSVEMERELEEYRALWRQGQRHQAFRWARRIREDARWHQLTDESKVKLLCFAASLELDYDHLDAARRLMAQAKSIGPSRQIDKLQAQIAFHENNVEGAITCLVGSNDIGTLNLLVALYLENQDVQEAHSLLHSTPLLANHNAETCRLRALYHLANHNIDQARIEIREALQLQSNWTAIQFTAAIVDYFQAIALNGLPKPLWPIPQPIPWTFIKRDKESLSLLYRAERNFKRLLDDHELNDLLRYQASAWRLACLASHPDYQSDANAYCRELLRQNPARPMYVEWAVARRYEVDFETSKQALWKLVNTNQAAPVHVQALYHLYVMEHEPDNAIQLLDRTKSLFVRTAQQHIWADWYGRVILLKDGADATLTYLEQSDFTSDLDDLRDLAKYQQAKENDAWVNIKATLEQEYAKTQNPYRLFVLCEWMAQQNDWRAITKWGDRLLKLLPTGDTLALVVLAHYNLHHYQICLDYLRNHKAFYRSLPPHLRRIQSQCLIHLGKLSQAIESHRELIHESPDVQDLVRLAYMYQLVGDQSRLNDVARQLLERPDLDATTSLQLARDLPDTALAAEFLQRRLPIEKLPDKQVVVAYTQALLLGLQKDIVNALRERLETLEPGEHSGYHKLEWNEVVEWMKQWRESASEITRLYQNGKGPIHSMSVLLNVNLADWYHTLLNHNIAAGSLLQTPAIFSRYAAREVMPEPPANMRLIMDVTAVLLAAHLGILDDVIEAFGPVWLPQPLMPLLTHLERQLTTRNLQWVNIQKGIYDAIQDKHIEVVTPVSTFIYPELAEIMGVEWATSLEKALSTGGYLVTQLPLVHQGQNIPLSQLPAEIASKIITAHAILISLRQEGPLSEAAYKKACDELRVGTAAPITAIPPQGVPLFFHGNALESLAQISLLDPVCKRFDVHVESREQLRIEQSLQMRRQAVETSAWLAQLQQQLHAKLKSGDCQFLPYLPNQEIRNDEPESPQEQCLLALFNFEVQAGDVVWVDDRWINHNIRLEGQANNAIADVMDVLGWLRNRARLSSEAYYAHLTHLRAANVRYLPVTADEIHYHLQQAHIQTDQSLLTETFELIALRRYVAACVLQNEFLEKPPMPPGSLHAQGEVKFLLDTIQATISAIYKIWMSDNPDEICAIRADWVMRNLYLDHAGIVTASNLWTATANKQHLAALSLYSFFIEPISTQPSWLHVAPEKLQRYYKWLEYRLITKRIDGGAILEMAVAILPSYLNMSRQPIPDERKVMALMGQTLYQNVPPKLQAALASNKAWVQQYLEGMTSIITIGDDIKFIAEDFFDAVRTILVGRETDIEIVDSQASTTFKLVEPYTFQFTHPEQGVIRVHDEVVGLLAVSLADREQVVRAHRHRFDGMTDSDFEAKVMPIVEVEDDLERIDLYKSMLEDNLIDFYEKLPQILSKGCRLDELLPPSTVSMERYFRLTLSNPDGCSWPDILDHGAARLIADRGLEMATCRFCTFPMPLPAAIMEGIAALDPSDQQEFIHRLVDRIGSPVSQMHLLYILLQFGEGHKSYHRLAQQVINSMLNSEDWGIGFSTFMTLLKWVYTELSRLHDVEGWTPSTQLAMSWAHTHYLFCSLIDASYSFDRINEVFASPARINEIALKRPQEIWFDCSQPHRINVVTFILSGLTYALGSQVVIPLFSQVVQQLKLIALWKWEDEVFVRPSLLHMNAMCNSLGAFLGYLREGESKGALWESLFNQELTRATYHSRLEAIIESLTADSSLEFSWDILYQALQDCAPPDHLVSPLRTLFKQTDFASLFLRNKRLGGTPIIVATYQARYVADEPLIRYLQEQFLQIVRIVGDDNPGTNNEGGYESFFLECAIGLARASITNDESFMAEFVAMISRLIATWGRATPFIKFTIQQFYESLPVTEAHFFAPLLMKVRSN